MAEPDLLLTDKHGRRLGWVQAEQPLEGMCLGKFVADAHGWTEDLRRLFEEYEEIINGQILSVLDEIEERVDAHGFRVVDPRSGRCFRAMDLQLLSGDELSFRVGPEIVVTE